MSFSIDLPRVCFYFSSIICSSLDKPLVVTSFFWSYNFFCVAILCDRVPLECLWVNYYHFSVLTAIAGSVLFGWRLLLILVLIINLQVFCMSVDFCYRLFGVVRCFWNIDSIVAFLVSVEFILFFCLCWFAVWWLLCFPVQLLDRSLELATVSRSHGYAVLLMTARLLIFEILVGASAFSD